MNDRQTQSAPMTADPSLGAQATAFWQIPPRGWLNILRRTYALAMQNNIGLLAAGVAFFLFLAFVPMLASIILLYGLFTDAADVAKHILLLAANLPSDVASVVATQLEAVTAAEPTTGGLGLLIALLLSLYGTTRGSGSLIGALNVVYGEEESRSFLRLTALTFILAIGAIIVGLGTVAAIAAQPAIDAWIPQNAMAARLVGIISWLLVIIIIAALVATIYRYAPCRAHARWSWLSPGAGFATLGCFAGSAAFSYYISNISSYGATYGALGTVVTFLMWLYLSAYIVLLGAELNAEIERQTAVDTTDGTAKPMGHRGAEMADQVATGPVAPPTQS